MAKTNKTWRILPFLGIALTLLGYFFLVKETLDLNEKRQDLQKENSVLEKKITNKKDELREYQVLIDSLHKIALQSADETTRERSEELLQDLPDMISTRFVKTERSNSNIELAENFEEEGFEHLINRRVDPAIGSFIKSENSFNSYHQVYEIAKYLNKNKEKLSDPESTYWTEAYRVLLRDYSWKMPEDIKEKLKGLINQ